MKGIFSPSAPAWAAGAALLLLVGCAHPFYRSPPPPTPLGAISDDIWRNQEGNAEASDFVIYQHEFKLNTPQLNLGGEDHVKEIALRLQEGAHFPVVVERSMTSPRADTEYQYPVHPNPQLDLARREVVVRALVAMGVHDAESRVVVAPAIAAGMHSTEAAAAYQRGFSGFGFGGFGGGFGGGIGGGMGGFF
jgi:hypothetical protein